MLRGISPGPTNSLGIRSVSTVSILQVRKLRPGDTNSLAQVHPGVGGGAGVKPGSLTPASMDPPSIWLPEETTGPGGSDSPLFDQVLPGSVTHQALEEAARSATQPWL